jgi:hypothetical protein
VAAQVVAVEAFVAEIKGEDVQVHDGDVFDAKHPVIKGREELFAPRQEHGVNVAPAPKRRRRS